MSSRLKRMVAHKRKILSGVEYSLRRSSYAIMRWSLKPTCLFFPPSSSSFPPSPSALSLATTTGASAVACDSRLTQSCYVQLHAVYQVNRAQMASPTSALNVHAHPSALHWRRMFHLANSYYIAPLHKWYLQKVGLGTHVRMYVCTQRHIDLIHNTYTVGTDALPGTDVA